MYLNKLDKTKDKFKYELSSIKSQNNRLEEMVKILEQENGNLRTEMRYIRK